MAYINIDEVFILDNTGLQVDQVTDLPYKDAGLSESQQAQARANIGAGGSNRNLLDNPFFSVRQRGDGPFTGNVYGVDRWRGSNSRTTVTGQSGYITLSTTSAGNGILRQILSQTYEGTYTLSAAVKGSGSGAIFFQDSGGNYIGTAEEFTVSGEELLVKTTFTTSGTPIGGVGIRVNTSNSIDVVAVKLELGSVSTLANDTPPNYAEELDKCRYYFERIKASTNLGLGTGIGNGTRFYAPFSIHPKRANPTISYTGTISIGRSAVETAITGIYTSGTECDYASGHIQLGVTVTNTSGTPYRLILEAGGTLDFSADL